MKTKIIISQLMVSMAPVIYLALIWNSLPQRVPLHFNAELVADSYGSKWTMAGVLFFLAVVTVGSSMLVLNVNRIDPKQKGHPLNKGSIRLSWAVVVLMTIIGVWIVYFTSRYGDKTQGGFSIKHVVALFALLLAVLGNYINTIKPNYFFGIRTPWTLADDDNWRKTHHLGSRVFFYGGILMFALAIALPVSFANYILIGGGAVLAVIPIGYSYWLFAKK
ncbi:MAG: SdpI family protein [Bacteroidetes bacterium]|nr:SdpI family protein [Bacteroidota bacterium]